MYQEKQIEEKRVDHVPCHHILVLTKTKRSRNLIKPCKQKRTNEGKRQKKNQNSKQE
jgi:hypothetical protein